MTESATGLPPSPEENLTFQALMPQIEARRADPGFKQAEAEAMEMIKDRPDELAAMYAIYKEQALTDPLTGLGNRRAFENDLAVRFSRAKRQLEKNGSAMPFVLVFVDADGLKKVNDDPAGGHPIGDKYLTAISDTLRNVRENEGAFRIGGDEFAVTLEDTSADGGQQVVQRLLEIFNQMRTERNLPLHTGLSVGLAQWSDGEDPLNLIRKADEALYIAKNAKKNV